MKNLKEYYRNDPTLKKLKQEYAETGSDEAEEKLRNYLSLKTELLKLELESGAGAERLNGFIELSQEFSESVGSVYDECGIKLHNPQDKILSIQGNKSFIDLLNSSGESVSYAPGKSHAVSIKTLKRNIRNFEKESPEMRQPKDAARAATPVEQQDRFGGE